MISNKKILVFKIAGEEFAADIMQVERILGFSEPTKIPEAPGFVKGVIKYQRKIIPVIDLNKRLHMETTSLSNDAKIIIVKHNEMSIGLIVDMVSEVVRSSVRRGVARTPAASEVARPILLSPKSIARRRIGRRVYSFEFRVPDSDIGLGSAFSVDDSLLKTRNSLQSPP
jgi:chemotaxis signal transduction protein